ncbi:plasmid recombination protein [Ancylobacter polymorphus]|uniref:Plasmid recombination protein n=1 Tax=Ancylobacter polymorphus TaxID=223390 RepID=A0A9E7D8E6_9HYPH|nr:plasmid recombination protein [Ancylobacter polymorphus]UOK73521.1 plasmid recombination protein [Ancylobacter polymorphus]
MEAFVAVRLQRFRNMAAIRAAEAHGRRMDETSKRRVDAARTPGNLAASQYCAEDPLALEAAFKAFKQRTGAVEGKNAAIMAHVIAIISPEVLVEAGDPRDPNNPRVRALFDQAQAWAKAEFGPEALIASRLDVDEAGSGIVDLYLCPTAMQAGGRGRPLKLTVSVKSALEGLAAREKELQGREGILKSFEALQDSWGRWACAYIDPRLKRGKPKRETQRQHVHADIFRERAERLRKREADLDLQERAESAMLSACQNGEIISADKQPGGKAKLTLRADLIGTPRHRELAELSVHVRPGLRGLLASIIAERDKAAQERRKAMEAVEIGVEALLAGEITAIENARPGEWKIHYNPEIHNLRKRFLSRILEPFKTIVCSFLTAFRQLLTRHDVEIKNYAESIERPGWSADYGPGM